MYAGFWRLNCGRAMIAAGSLLMILAIPVITEADEEPNAELPAHRVVLRVSEAMLDSLMDNNGVDRQIDVRDVILGTTIYGKARIVGKSGVRLVDSPDQATFHITFDGAAYSGTTGYNGPAIIQSRSVTTFTATKQIVFEPGKGFYGLPSKVTARTQVFVEGIGSTRGGLIGRIVGRQAAKAEAAQHAAATEIARQKAERQIAVALDRKSVQQLARSNGVADFRSIAVAALQTTGSGEPKYACCTTPHYLQIAASFGETGLAIDLPVSAAADTRGAPIQLWLHKTLVGEGIVAGIDVLNAKVSASDLFNVISATTLIARGSTDMKSQIRSLLSEQQIQIHKAGDWQVIEVEMPTQESRSTARTHAPGTQSN